ncbi:TonB-dependent receptor [Gammaproteobacteria bacterium]|nr:TonB-dependent receptor [Gammaproteobacteria bacterium]
MRHSLTFFLFFTFFGTLIANVSEDVYVTGSVIKKTSLLVANPISTFDLNDIEKRGTLYIENFLSYLPQIHPSNSNFHSNKATGTSSVSLRGLGGTRTLILMNGKRLSPGTPMNGTAEQDLSQIPFSLIKQVDVLTGGKSTIYGSDAIGGVINFQLKRKFSGIDLSYQHSFYNHQNEDPNYERKNYDLAPNSVSDGHANTLQFSLGYEIFQDIYLTSYFNYRSVDEVTWSQRDISVCALSGNAECRASSTSPEGKFVENKVGGKTFHVKDNTFASGSTFYNFASKNHLLRPDKKNDVGILLTFENLEKHTFNVDYFKSSHKTVGQLDYSGIFRLSVDLPCNNPFLSNQQFTAICSDNGLTLSDSAPLYISRRNIEGNPRQQNFKHSTDRFVFDVDGEITNEWFYNLSFQSSRTTADFTYFNDISKQRAIKALKVSGTPSNPSCVSGNDCKPWNIFINSDRNLKSSAALGVTKEALDYISTNLRVNAELTEDQYRFVTSKSFTTKNALLPSLEMALGLEYRELNLKKNADDFSDGAGQQYPHSNLYGSLKVKELFSEIYLPLVTDTNLNFSIRYSDYSLEENSLTYDIGLVQLFEEKYTLKFSQQKAIRMPDINDLYSPTKVNQAFLNSDPCSGSNPSKSISECARTGVTESLYGNISNTETQINSLIGGNLNLRPETAITNSLSFLYSDEIDLEIDFYSISLKDKIGSSEVSFILDNCLETGASYYCNLIERNPTTGTFYEGSGKIASPLLNVSSQNISGLDLNISKTFDVDFGEIRLNNFLSYLLKNDIQLRPSLPIEDCKGKYENTCGLPSPQIQNIFSMDFIYKVSQFDASSNLTMRYIDGVDDSNTQNPIDFSSYYYLDMNFSIDLANDINFSFGINNIFDKNPPLNGKSINYVPGNANTYPSYYDPLGRFVYLNISKRIY